MLRARRRVRRDRARPARLASEEARRLQRVLGAPRARVARERRRRAPSRAAQARGDDRAKQAAERALKSPLIDTEIVGARGILLSIAGGEDLTLLEVNDAAETVRQAATDDTNIIFGATVDERLAGQVWVTVVATGLGGTRRRTAPTFTANTSPTRTEDPLEPPSFLRN